MAVKEKMYTLTELEPILGLKHLTLQKYAQSGKLPATKLDGGKWRVRESDLKKYMKPTNRRKPGHPPKIQKIEGQALFTGCEMKDGHIALYLNKDIPPETYKRFCELANSLEVKKESGRKPKAKAEAEAEE